MESEREKTNHLKSTPLIAMEIELKETLDERWGFLSKDRV